MAEKNSQEKEEKEIQEDARKLVTTGQHKGVCFYNIAPLLLDPQVLAFFLFQRRLRKREMKEKGKKVIHSILFPNPQINPLQKKLSKNTKKQNQKQKKQKKTKKKTKNKKRC